ncbi:MAG: hypothetical protein V4710_02035 [Verrucomicrobiota bacterium]
MSAQISQLGVKLPEPDCECLFSLGAGIFADGLSARLQTPYADQCQDQEWQQYEKAVPPEGSGNG